MSTEEPDIASGAQLPLAKLTNRRTKKKIGIFTDGKYGQQVDIDINYKASQYVGRKCEMTLFNPNALPPTLLEGIRPLINRPNMVNSFEYEADLLIFEGCWRQSQTSDFQSYLEAPPTANPPSKVMVKRRAMAVLFDLFGDPPQEWKNEADVELSSYRNVARFLFHLRKTRPRLVKRKSPVQRQSSRLAEYGHQFPAQEESGVNLSDDHDNVA